MLRDVLTYPKALTEPESWRDEGMGHLRVFKPTSLEGWFSLTDGIRVEDRIHERG
ncbi:hypothetical protein [Desulfosporosinus acididurans]|uniref:hypothetical protein n=1 Tax=Desulfosporosinus acididurans TaxID=476652 RepID=UPI000B317B97|nr:hypothetical protein [Desulfosporosinus acididurans]